MDTINVGDIFISGSDHKREITVTSIGNGQFYYSDTQSPDGSTFVADTSTMLTGLSHAYWIRKVIDVDPKLPDWW